MTDISDIDPDVLADLLSQYNQTNLSPLSPTDALEMYLGMREGEIADSTYRTHNSRLSAFVEWCEENHIENLNNLDGRDLQNFRNWRKEQLGSTESLRSNLITLRLFLQACVKFDAVPPGIPSKVAIPTVSEEPSRDDIVDSKFAAEIRTYLDEYEYATLDHVVWAILTDAGIRLSPLHGSDLGDFTRTQEGGTLELLNRPESNTRLKNGENSERIIHLSERTAEIVSDYIEIRRKDETDEFGRKPLLTSADNGRLTKSSIRRIVYAWTRPCIVRNHCPAGVPEEEFDECEARSRRNLAYKCPESTSTHSIRRAYLTTELDKGVDTIVLSDRCDVTPEIIDQHYDMRDGHEKMRLRTELRERTYSQSGNSGYATEKHNDGH